MPGCQGALGAAAKADTAGGQLDSDDKVTIKLDEANYKACVARDRSYLDDEYEYVPGVVLRVKGNESVGPVWLRAGG